jgi:hypothetical protein
MALVIDDETMMPQLVEGALADITKTYEIKVDTRASP